MQHAEEKMLAVLRWENLNVSDVLEDLGADVTLKFIYRR
jgi:hypothetical protein